MYMTISQTHLTASECPWRVFIPLIELPARRNRRSGKMVNQSPWLTLNDRDTWHRRKALTKYYRDQGTFAARFHWLPTGLQKVHVVASVAYGSNRVLDPHNYMLTAKAVIDGFRDYGLIPDDNSKHLIGPDMRRDESQPRGLTMYVTVLEE